MNSVPSVPLVSVQPATWWESLQKAIERALIKLHLSSQDIVHIISFVIGGAVVGFLFKKYLKYLFIFTLVFVLLLIMLDRSNWIAVNWSMTGIDPQVTVQQSLQNMVNMVRDNMVLSVSAFVGFIVGYSIG